MRLAQVDPTGDWAMHLKNLGEEDIRGPGKDDDEISEGQREPSWIWLVPRARSVVVEEELDDHIRVEWVKLKARADRWDEEVRLLAKEMRRTLVYFTWKARWWREQAGRCTTDSPALREGLTAYAEKQASILEGLAQKFTRRWLPALKANGMTPVWERQFLSDSNKALASAESSVDDADDESPDGPWEDDGEDSDTFSDELVDLGNVN